MIISRFWCMHGRACKTATLTSMQHTVEGVAYACSIGLSPTPPRFLTFRGPWGRGKCVSVTSLEWYRVTAAVFVNTISEQTKKLWSEITALWRSSLCPLTLLCTLVTMWDFYQFVYYISFPRNASVALFLSCALISHLANKQNWENIVHNKGGLVSENLSICRKST